MMSGTGTEGTCIIAPLADGRDCRDGRDQISRVSSNYYLDYLAKLENLWVWRSFWLVFASSYGRLNLEGIVLTPHPSRLLVILDLSGA
jgi:hypothetical protein